MPFVFSPFTGTFTPTGPNVIPTTTYTPTIANGPTATVTARYWRVNDRLHMAGEMSATAAGAASVMTISLPAGYTMPVNASGVFGSVKFFVSGVGIYVGVAAYASTSTFNLVTSRNASNSVLGNAFANGDVISWILNVPIA